MWCAPRSLLPSLSSNHPLESVDQIVAGSSPGSEKPEAKGPAKLSKTSTSEVSLISEDAVNDRLRHVETRAELEAIRFRLEQYSQCVNEQSVCGENSLIQGKRACDAVASIDKLVASGLFPTIKDLKHRRDELKKGVQSATVAEGLEESLREIEEKIEKERCASRRLHRDTMNALACAPCGEAFLSHSGQDEAARDFTAFLAKSLRESKVRVFYDTHSLRAGDTSLFICISSSTYCCRYWCMYELDTAMRRRRPILPVYLDGVLPDIGPDGRERMEDAFHLGKYSVDDQTMDRWMDNLRQLRLIQGIRDDSMHKDSRMLLCQTVTDHVHETLVLEEVKSKRPDP